MARELKKNYKGMGWWESYQRELMTEYRQSIEEGLDIEAYKELFEAVDKMPDDEYKDKASDVLFNIVYNAKIKDGYKYNEPSDLVGIKALCQKYKLPKRKIGKREMEKKVHGAWMGRVVGCLLGKPVEGVHTYHLHQILKQSENFPLHRYINKCDLGEEILNNPSHWLINKCWADTVS